MWRLFKLSDCEVTFEVGNVRLEVKLHYIFLDCSFQQSFYPQLTYTLEVPSINKSLFPFALSFSNFTVDCLINPSLI